MKKTLYLLLFIFSMIVNSATIHEVRTEQEFENAVRSASPEDEIKLMNSISLVNGYNYSESTKLNNGNGYGSVDLNGIKLNGNGHRLKLVGRNIVLHGTSVFQDIDITLGLPDSTSGDSGNLADLSKSAIIYANGHNLTLDNVSFTPEASDALGVRPTIIMGSAPSIPSGNSSEVNTLTIANSTKPVELRTIVAGSYNTEKTTKTIINLDSKVNLVGSPNAEILLKNLNNDTNLSVDVVNESKDVRTFKTTDDATDVNINLKNVEYGENANKLAKFDGKINNLSLNDGTKVILYSPLNVNSIELKKSDESQVAPELKVSKSNVDFDDDDVVISNQANGSITANKVISNNDESKIILDKDATIIAKTVEGKFQFDGDDKKFEGYTSPTDSSDTSGNNPDSNSQPPQNPPVNNENDNLQGDDPQPTENPSEENSGPKNDKDNDSATPPKNNTENNSGDSTIDNQDGAGDSGNTDTTDSTETGENSDNETSDNSNDNQDSEKNDESNNEKQGTDEDKSKDNSQIEKPAEPKKEKIENIEIPLNGNTSRIVDNIIGDNYELMKTKRINGMWAVISGDTSNFNKEYKVKNSGVIVGYDQEFEKYAVGVGISHNKYDVKDTDKINAGNMTNAYVYGDYNVGSGKVEATLNVGKNESKLGNSILYGAKLGYEYPINISEKLEVIPAVEMRYLAVKEKSYNIPEKLLQVEGKTVDYLHGKVGTKLAYRDKNFETYIKYGLDFNFSNKEEIRNVKMEDKSYINKNKKVDSVVNELSLGTNYLFMNNLRIGLDYKLKKGRNIKGNTVNLLFEYIF